jgi:hypothetical protein
MWKYWKTILKIPLLNETTAKSFMQMIMMVSRIAEVPNRAHWIVKHEDDEYTVYAIYKEYPYIPLKERNIIRFR